MKGKRFTVLLAVVVVLAGLVCWMGVGYRSNGSAVRDLKGQLQEIYGAPYTGKAVGTGTEDMDLSVEPTTWFMTNPGWRRFFGLDYRYRCEVVYTTYADGKVDQVRKFIYTGFDPMGRDTEDLRAYLKPGK